MTTEGLIATAGVFIGAATLGFVVWDWDSKRKARQEQLKGQLLIFARDPKTMIAEIQVLLLSFRNEGLDPDTRYKGNKTALMHAAYQGHFKLVEVLINDGHVDVNLQDDKGETALWKVTVSGMGKQGDRNQIIELLKKAGAKPILEEEPEKDGG